MAMSGNPYDWNLDKVAVNMNNMSEAISIDRARRAQENSQNIINQKNMVEMEKTRKHEELLDKDVMWGTMLQAKGASPEATQASIEYAKSIGVGDNIGKVKFRNLPFLLKTMDDDKEFKVKIHDINDAGLAKAETELNDEITKINENRYTNPEKYAKDQEVLPQKIRMRDQLKANRASLQAQKNQLLGIKADTNKNVVMAPGATMVTPEGKSVFTAPKEDKPDDWMDWGHGQKKNKTTGQIVNVPVAPKQGATTIVQSTFVDPKTGLPLVFDKNTQTYKVAQVEGGGGVTAKPGAPSPEKAAKEQLVSQALSYMPDIKQMILGADFENKPSVDRSTVLNAETRMPFTKGRQASTLILDAVEAKLRAESGAAVPETEVKRIAKRYIPQVADDDATIIMKLNNMEKFLQGTQDKMQMGKTPQAKGSAPKSDPLGLR
jgi:hypothetical protein